MCQVPSLADRRLWWAGLADFLVSLKHMGWRAGLHKKETEQKEQLNLLIEATTTYMSETDRKRHFKHKEIQTNVNQIVTK